MATPVYVDQTALENTLELQGTTFATADITQAIAAASRWIDQACDRRFYADVDANQVRTYWPENNGYCIIDDLVQFTSLVAQQSTWTLGTDFYLEPQNAPADGQPYMAIRTIVRPFLFTKADLAPGWAGFDGRITVTGMFGWPAFPDEIVQATTILAGRLLSRARTPTGVVAVGMDGIGVRLPSLDPDVQALIGPYVRSFIA